MCSQARVPVGMHTASVSEQPSVAHEGVAGADTGANAETATARPVDAAGEAGDAPARPAGITARPEEVAAAAAAVAGEGTIQANSGTHSSCPRKDGPCDAAVSGIDATDGSDSEDDAFRRLVERLSGSDASGSNAGSCNADEGGDTVLSASPCRHHPAPSPPVGRAAVVPPAALADTRRNHSDPLPGAREGNAVVGQPSSGSSTGDDAATAAAAAGFLQRAVAAVAGRALGGGEEAAETREAKEKWERVRQYLRSKRLAKPRKLSANVGEVAEELKRRRIEVCARAAARCVQANTHPSHARMLHPGPARIPAMLCLARFPTY